jgi:uncharacterized delta-60 repeat protein
MDDAPSASSPDATPDVAMDASDASDDASPSDDSPGESAPPYDGPTGTPDPTFGESGTGSTITPSPIDGGSFGQVSALALDPDAGTIALTGTALLADQVSWETAVARYTPTGTPDTTFASTGLLLTNYGLSTQPVGAGLAIQPDHKLLVSGFGYASLTVSGFYVARLGTTGALDITFASSGLLHASPPSGSFDQAYPLLLDSSGLYVGGWEGTGTTSDFALWRYSLSATPVSTFGTAGKVTTLLAASKEAHATAMARQSTQKILLAGHIYDSSASSYDAAIARYTTAGVLDTTFGTSGIALTGQSGTAAVTSIAVQPDDRIVAAGYTSPGTDTQLTVWRLTAAGALDSTFGTGGVAVFSFTALGGRATGVALQTDGRIVVTGSVSGLGTSNMTVFRLLPDGTVDGDFNGGPIISSSALVDSADAVAIQADGAIVVAGTSNYGELTVWRYR